MRASVLNLSAGIALGLLATAGVQSAAACDCAIFTSEYLTLAIDQITQADGQDADLTAEEARWGGDIAFSKNIDDTFSVIIQTPGLDTYLTLEEVGAGQ